MTTTTDPAGHLGLAVVTGGAGDLGRACVTALEELGYRVVVTWHEHEPDHQPAVRCDITDDDAVRAAFEQIEAEHGPVEAVVCNAGASHLAMSLRAEAADIRAIVDTNLVGSYLTARAAATAMVRRRRGRIVLVSSVAALYGEAGMASYSAAKAGLIGLGRAMAREFGGRGITVNVVAPGLLENAKRLDQEHTDPRIAEAWIAGTPLGRLGLLSEAAATIAFLADPRAGFITGAVVPVDGGYAMGWG